LPSSKSWRHFLVTTSLALATVLATYAGSAFADVDKVTTSPGTITVPARGLATINIVWRVGTTGSVARNVTSSTAELKLNNSTIATLGGNLSTTTTLNNGPETVLLRESYVFNAALARRIAASPAGSLQITRQFGDGGRVATGQVNVYSGSSNAGPLAVRRIDLAFENSARTDVVSEDDVVHAIADISFRSSGILKGEWRIVEPSASLGSSGGRVLRVIRQNLVSSGEGRTRIVSPALPTLNSGLHLVSFVVEDTSIEIPILRYFVLDNVGTSIETEPGELIILSPGDDVGLDQNTIFKWQSVAGAQAFQIEIFNKDEEVPLTGKIVPATESKLTLSPLSFEWLTPGNEYTWHLRAFGVGGKLLAQSKRQSLYLK